MQDFINHLDTVEASLNVKLKYLEDWNNRRREIARIYQEGITNSKITLQSKPDYADGIYHLFVVTVENRAHFVDYLKQNGIAAAFHYPVPCHLQKAYSHLAYKKGDFPNSEYLAEHCVSLPMFPELSEDEIFYILKQINNY